MKIARAEVLLASLQHSVKTGLTLAFASAMTLSCSSASKKTPTKPETAAVKANALLSSPIAVTEQKLQSAAPGIEESVKKAETGSKGESVQHESTRLTCTHGEDSRTLTVETHGQGCNADYTKGGKTSSVATANSGTDHCQKTIDKIRAKLESSGFACKKSDG